MKENILFYRTNVLLKSTIYTYVLQGGVDHCRERSGRMPVNAAMEANDWDNHTALRKGATYI